MRNASPITSYNNEKGYLFPFVLVVTMLCLSFLFTSLLIYKQSLLMSQNEYEQIKMETLFQMAQASFRAEIPTLSLTTNRQSISYSFPHGNVTVIYLLTDANHILTNYLVYTKEGSKGFINQVVSLQ